MLLNLRQIEVFRAIMLTGSISKAAQLLNVSQPAISRLLSYTESRIGLVLFERIKGRLYPTPEARRLYQEVEQVHNSVQRVNEVATDLIEKRHGSLHIAVSPSLGQTLIPMAVTRFRQAFPDVKVYVRTLISSDLVQFLMWAAEPKLEERKKVGINALIFLIVFAGLLFFTKRKLWSNVDH